uniref:Uncharacterized protein n=1 Tax=Arundo donax TaxID=35708 RepID=A0A0A9E9A7_ARUDO
MASKPSILLEPSCWPQNELIISSYIFLCFCIHDQRHSYLP